MILICETTAGDNATGYQFALLAIDAKQAQELLKHRDVFDLVKARLPGLFCVEVYECTVEWCENVRRVDLDSMSIGDNLDWHRVVSDKPLVLEDLVGEQHSSDAETIKITSSEILWSGSPKHADAYFETRGLTWDMLREIAEDKWTGPTLGLVEEEDAPA